MIPARLAALAGLACTAACAPGVRTAPAPAAVRVALVDSVPFVTEMHEGVLRRVEVRTPRGTDTIAEILTFVAPVVTADGRVLGFAWEGADLREAFAYDPASRRVERTALPEDADRSFTTPAFSPDGRHLAYVSYAEQGGWGRGIVRRDVRGPVVVRTDSVAVPGTDAAVSFAAWLDAETFEIYLDVGEEGWHRFHGTLSAGVVRNDTVQAPRPQSAERRHTFFRRTFSSESGAYRLAKRPRRARPAGSAAGSDAAHAGLKPSPGTVHNFRGGFLVGCIRGMTALRLNRRRAA